MYTEIDEEMKKEMILNCLQLDIEIKKLKRQLYVKKKENFQLRRHNKKLNNKLKLFINSPIGGDQYQDIVKMKNCSVELEDVEKKREKNLEKTKKNSKKVNFLLKNGKYVCQHQGCGRLYKSYGSFWRHGNTHTTKHQCQICQKCFPGSVNLQQHFRVHTDERPFECDWIGCGKRFKLKVSLQQHVKWQHLNERPFHCNRNGCEKSFKMKGELKTHLETVHSSLRLFQCPVQGCEMSFKRNNKLTRHTKDVHA